MTDFHWIGFGLMGAWFLGVAVAFLIFGSRLLAIPVKRTGFLVARAEVVGLGCVLGIPVISYLQFLWSFAGGKLGRGCSLFLAIGGFVLGVHAWWKARRVNPSLSIELDNILRKSPREDTKLVRCYAAILLLIFLSALAQTLLTPQRFWDERAFYGLKAIVLFEDRTIFSSDLAERDFIQGHPRYPLMISIAEQYLYSLLGRVDDRWSKVLFPVLFAGLVLVTGGVLSRHYHPNRAWLGALMLATMPVLMPDDYGIVSGQADAPVACLEGLAILYIWSALETVDSDVNQATRLLPSFILAGLAAGLNGFTKDEGISYIATHVVALAGSLLTWRLGLSVVTSCDSAGKTTGISRSVRTIAASGLVLVAIPGILLAPWLLHRRHLPITGEMNYFGRLSWSTIWSGLGTLTWSIPHLAHRMFVEAPIWGMQWWLLVVMFVLFPKRAMRPPQVFLLLNLAGAIAALLLAGMLAPVVLDEHIGGSSHRYLMQISPAVLLFSLGQFARSAAVSKR